MVVVTEAEVSVAIAPEKTSEAPMIAVMIVSMIFLFPCVDCCVCVCNIILARFALQRKGEIN